MKILNFETIDSTNEYAKKNIDSLENETLILTEEQTAGKGTHDRTWSSQKGKNILMTMVYKPETSINLYSNLTIEIARMIIQVIFKLYKHELKIKHPNDIILNGKKMGGILVETLTKGEKIKYIIIGIGLNVNQIEFPNELSDIATSLSKEFNTNYDKSQIVSELCNELNAYMNIVKSVEK